MAARCPLLRAMTTAIDFNLHEFKLQFYILHTSAAHFHQILVLKFCGRSSGLTRQKINTGEFRSVP